MEEPEQKLKDLIKIIKEGQANGASAEEILLAIKDEEIVTRIIKPPLQSSPERLQYLKEYRLMRKELEAMKLKADKKEQYKIEKITQALKRTGFFCYKCKKPIKCLHENNKHSIEIKKNQKRPKIIISNQCPSCENIVRQFGGYL